jgi:hypothetical protein
VNIEGQDRDEPVPDALPLQDLRAPQGGGNRPRIPCAQDLWRPPAAMRGRPWPISIQFSVELPLTGPDQVEAARNILNQRDAGMLEEAGDEPRDFDLESRQCDGRSVAWIHDGEGQGSPNHVILFVQLPAARSAIPILTCRKEGRLRLRPARSRAQANPPK